MAEIPPDDIALGIDVGGTFTDLVVLDRVHGKIISRHKIPSTPDDPSRAAIAIIDRYLDRHTERAQAVFHGTTVGTNTLIQKHGAKTALVATKGFRDILALRRHARPRLYDLSARVSPPLVPRELRLEALERIRHDGAIEVPLSAGEVDRIITALKAEQIEAVAISLLHAYANDEHERILAEAIETALPNVFVSLSSDVTAEFREYERTSTVVVNAYIGPRVADYLDRLGKCLGKRKIPDLAIVKSNGGLTSAANAARYPVHLIESGPSAGVIATAALGRTEGLRALIAFDMGGTTAKVGLVEDGRPRLSTQFHADRFVEGRDMGGYPIKSPVIDLVEVGAGGGSIAWLDHFGVLKVGPESAGAEPGPACYGRGGELPTMTDAHIALGHIDADGFISEGLAIDASLAKKAIEGHVAGPLGWTVERAAHGILTLANATMAEVVRLATVRRGIDPRDFTLVAFGGAGPMHASEIARDVGIPRILVPSMPGLFSAIGTTLGEVRHDLVQTIVQRDEPISAQELNGAFSRLSKRASSLLAGEAPSGKPAFERHADLRYSGQMFEMTLPAPIDISGTDLERTFRTEYMKEYGYDLPNQSVEIVNLRLVARLQAARAHWKTAPIAAEGTIRSNPKRRRHMTLSDGREEIVDVIVRDTIQDGETLVGPLVIEDYGATTRILSGQKVTARSSGTLLIEETNA